MPSQCDIFAQYCLFIIRIIYQEQILNVFEEVRLLVSGISPKMELLVVVVREEVVVVAIAVVAVVVIVVVASPVKCTIDLHQRYFYYII